MEDWYRVDHAIQFSDEITGAATGSFDSASDFQGRLENIFPFHDLHSPMRSNVTNNLELCRSEMSDLIKAQIASHPRYPNLIAAYIECRKVGAPPEMASILEEIGRETHPIGSCGEIGADPELDEFMESYCEVLLRYKEELSKPFQEATTFLSKIETQLSNLCKGTSATTDDAGVSSEDEISYGDIDILDNQDNGPHPGDPELKEMLLKKYSGYLSSLRKEFLKKRKKGKLPREARLALLDWWNTHYRWPYPTEEDKLKLGEQTGLDQKQINNWFINQRKRHWKPSEDMRFALMEGVADIGRNPYFIETGNSEDP